MSNVCPTTSELTVMPPSPLGEIWQILDFLNVQNCKIVRAPLPFENSRILIHP